MNVIIVAGAIVFVAAILVFALLTYSYFCAIKRINDLEDRLMARNLTEYSDKKQRDAIISVVDKSVEHEELNTDKFEKPLSEDEVE